MENKSGLSRQPSRTEELTANISEQAQRVGATFVPSAEKIETYEAARVARQHEAEPVAWIEFADNGNIRFWTSDPARAWTEGDNGRPLRKFTLAEIVALAASPRLDRERLAALLTSAKLLLQNAIGCAANHYGQDFERHGKPAWLMDAEKDIAAADAIMRETR